MSDQQLDYKLLKELRARMLDYLHFTGREDVLTKKICCVDPGHTDVNPSMGYDKRNKRLHCFGCGKSFDLFDLICLDYPLCSSFPSQVRKACEVFGLSIPANVPDGRSVVVPKVSLESDFTEFIQSRYLASGAGGVYFRQRGIPDELCRKYQLFQWEGSAYLPVFHGDRCVSYCVRQIAVKESRYRNSPGSMEIFGGDLLRLPGVHFLVVTESIFDALSVEVCGYPAVALCGTGNVKRFLALCKQCPDFVQRRFLLAGDADEAGARTNQELEHSLVQMGAKTVRIKLPQGAKDLNDALLHHYEVLRASLSLASGEIYVAHGSAFIESDRGVGSHFSSEPIATGLTGLDVLLEGGLYTGLYVLGAISSLGKTSLALQIADTIAEAGRDVLYFTLEMSGTELAAKSISRISVKMDPSTKKMNGLTVRQVLQQQGGTLLKKAFQRYREGAGKHVLFVEDSVSVQEIMQTVSLYQKRYGAPVVIVDYLQILQPLDNRGTDKQNTDRAVVALKRLSREYTIPVIAISSFNRENYRNPVSMEAFKESGAVEYSSDVLLGLQLAGVGEPRFDANIAKLRSPRQVELVLLKNRSGAPYGIVPLRYYANLSLFCER